MISSSKSSFFSLRFFTQIDRSPTILLQYLHSQYYMMMIRISSSRKDSLKAMMLGWSSFLWIQIYRMVCSISMNFSPYNEIFLATYRLREVFSQMRQTLPEQYSDYRNCLVLRTPSRCIWRDITSIFNVNIAFSIIFVSVSVQE